MLALGSYSPLMLRAHGIDLPVYPVKGYSLTVPITDPAGAPESTVMDEKHKVAITRLGDRIRVGGTLGWTMACGSGAVLADLVSGRAPAIDARPLDLDRYTAAGKALTTDRKKARA